MNLSKTKAHEQFCEIGRKLKTAREAKGIGMGELSANIRIHQNYLHAIETGELEKLPAFTFLRGFLRNYAVAVGLNDTEILADFKAMVEVYNPGPMPLEPPAEVAPQPMVTFSPGKALLVVAIVAMIGWALYLIVQVATAPDAGVSNAENPAAPGTAAEQGPASPAGQPPSAAPLQPNAPAVPGAPQAALPVEPPRNLQLTLKGLERSWVRLSVDRREPVDVLLDPAETGEWEANEEFRITIGKSHGVSVYLNGEEITLPREHNQLISELVLNKLTLLKLEN